MLAEVPVYRDNLDSKAPPQQAAFPSPAPSEDTNSRSGPGSSPSPPHTLTDTEPGSTLSFPKPDQSSSTTAPTATRKKNQKRSVVCEFLEDGKPQCKQRAILSYRYCIRHILNDTEAPYMRCEFMIRGKIQCTNAIKMELNNRFCSTHLIKRGEKEAKRRKKPEQSVSDAQSESNMTSPSVQGGLFVFAQQLGSDDLMNSSFESTDQQRPMKESPRFLNGVRPDPSRFLASAQSNSSNDTKRLDFHSDPFPHSSKAMSTTPQPEDVVNGDGRVVRQNMVYQDPRGGQLVHRYPANEARPELHHPPPRPRPPPMRCPLDFVNCKSQPVHYDGALLDVGQELDEVEQLKRDYLNDKPEKPARLRKEVQLSHKCRSIRIHGSFRAIPQIDNMCTQIESSDFDSADLFPLGFEPSDSECSSDEEFGLEHFPSLHIAPKNVQNCRLELYLLKKRLKRESEKLQRNARISVNVITAARAFPDQVGVAFRVREATRKRRNLQGVSSTIQRCFYRDHGTRQRCTNMVIPRSSMCADHISYSVGQHAFAFCKVPGCGRAVLKLNALFTEGKCEMHHLGCSDRPENGIHQPVARATVLPQVNGHGSIRTNTTQFVHNHLPLGQQHPVDTNNPRRVSDPDIAHGDRQLINSITVDDFDVTDANSVVDGDVSLSSVANELFDNAELNDMLSQFPSVDDAAEHADDGLEDGENLLNVFTSAAEEGDMGHSWADISEFLRSEGYSGSSSPTNQQTSPGQ